MTNKPSYYANLPADVRYDENLKPNEKLLYAEITALANKNGYSWATNQYFAELYNVKKGTVSGWISNLEKNGYVKTKLIYSSNKQVKERRIYLSHTLSDKNHIPYDTKIDDPMPQKSKEELNTTRPNTTSINKKSSHKSQKRYSDDSPYIKLAERLYNHLKSRNPEHIEPNWQKWADDFRKAHKIDKRSIENLEEVIDWSQNDSFWQNNIMSAFKVREKYDQLKLQMNNSPMTNWKQGGNNIGHPEF